ncbi:unnamed protein product, partial [Timema podura]|nr:unnamed protein product [Timema podura]
MFPIISTVAPGLHLLKETIISSLRLSADKQTKKRRIVLPGENLPKGHDGIKLEPNFIATQQGYSDRTVTFVGSSVVNYASRRVVVKSWQNSDFVRTSLCDRKATVAMATTIQQYLVTGIVPFTLDVVFESSSFIERDETLFADTYTRELQRSQDEFHHRSVTFTRVLQSYSV